MVSLKEYVEFINENLNVTLPEKYQEVHKYLLALDGKEQEKSKFSALGIQALEYMQQNPEKSYTSKEIAEGLVISARQISGSMTKLWRDGYVEKLGKSPVIYTLSDLGKNIDLNEFKGEND